MNSRGIEVGFHKNGILIYASAIVSINNSDVTARELLRRACKISRRFPRSSSKDIKCTEAAQIELVCEKWAQRHKEARWKKSVQYMNPIRMGSSIGFESQLP
jgi:hypothetical protein